MKRHFYRFLKTSVVTVVIVLSLVGLTVCSSTTSGVYSSTEEWVVDDNYSVTHTLTDSTIQIQFVLRNSKTGWMGLAFNEFAYPADTIVAWYDYDTSTAYCWDAFNPAFVDLDSFSSPIQDDDPLIASDEVDENFNQNNVTLVSSSVADGVTTIVCERDLLTGDAFDYQIRTDRDFDVWAGYNESTGFVNEDSTLQAGTTNSGLAIWDL